MELGICTSAEPAFGLMRRRYGCHATTVCAASFGVDDRSDSLLRICLKHAIVEIWALSVGLLMRGLLIVVM